MSQPSDLDSSKALSPSNKQDGWKAAIAPALLTLIWLVYIGYLLLSDFPPGDSLLHLSTDTLREAIALSLNFWFVMPLLFPDVAPVLNPVLEGIFNIVIAWALLFWGFLLDGRRQRWPMTPFLLGTALLTNVFYLPWLALRRQNAEPIEPPLSRLESFTESKTLPIGLAAVCLASVLWAVFGRPYVASRWTDFQGIL
ncbi:MAG: hypothetical protein LPJ97_12220, partial [Marinobacter sp.]|nr:hypothetical protein [Marinobacter sp.]